MKSEENTKPKKTGFFTQKLYWWQILLGLALVASLTYTKIQDQTASTPQLVKTEIQKHYSTEEITQDVTSLTDVVTNTITSSELKTKSEPILVAMELKYKGNEDLLKNSNNFISTIIAMRTEKESSKKLKN